MGKNTNDYRRNGQLSELTKPATTVTNLSSIYGSSSYVVFVQLAQERHEVTNSLRLQSLSLLNMKLEQFYSTL